MDRATESPGSDRSRSARPSSIRNFGQAREFLTFFNLWPFLADPSRCRHKITSGGPEGRWRVAEAQEQRRGTIGDAAPREARRAENISLRFKRSNRVATSPGAWLPCIRISIV